jgi:hypothetical protein
LSVEIRKCLAWYSDNGYASISASRIASWFEKAKEIQKREQLRQMERKEAEIRSCSKISFPV